MVKDTCLCFIYVRIKIKMAPNLLIRSNSNEDITSEKTEHIKGIAIILMMWHHLFGCNFLETWLSPFIKAEILFGIYAKIGVAVFLFCSGYGLYKSYISKDISAKKYIPLKLVKTFIPYWIVMIIAIICLIILGKFKPQYILINLFAWDDSVSIMYVSFAWYIKLYIMILLIMPLIKIYELKSPKSAVIDFVIFLFVPLLILYALICIFNGKNLALLNQTLVDTGLWTFIIWFPSFAEGFLFAKYEIYKRIKTKINKLPQILTIITGILISVSTFILRYFFSFLYLTDFIYAPLLIIGILLTMDNLKWKSKYIIPYLGKKSIYYWLLSSMFFLNTSELLPAITWPRLPILILIWSLLLLTPFVFGCDWLANKAIRLVCKFLKLSEQ